MPPKKRTKSSSILKLNSYRSNSAANKPQSAMLPTNTSKKSANKVDGRYLELQERLLAGKCAKKAVQGFVIAAPILSRTKMVGTYKSAVESDGIFSALEHAEPKTLPPTAASSSNVKKQSREWSNVYGVLADEGTERKPLFTPAPSILAGGNGAQFQSRILDSNIDYGDDDL